MISKIINCSQKNTSKNSLRQILILPFVLQIFTTVILIGYLSFRNGEKAVNRLVTQLENEITNGVEEHLNNYLEYPQIIVESNINGIQLEQLNTKNADVLSLHFLQQIHLFKSVRAIYFVGDYENGEYGLARRNLDGTFKMRLFEDFPNRVSYLVNKEGQRIKILQVKPYYPQTRPWYKAAVETGKPTWSPIYNFTEGELGITFSAPVFNKTGTFGGVIAVDLILNQISNFLAQQEISPNGQVFLLETSGDLIASSTSEKPYVVPESGKKPQRLPAVASQDPLTQATAKYLMNEFGNLDQINRTLQLKFDIDGRPHFLKISPINQQGLDWIIAIAIPVSDMMAEINANTRTTILLCIIALIVAIVVGIITASSVIAPILQLNNSAKSLAQGKWKKTVRIKRNDEVGELTQSFNQMAKQLQESFETLEQRVEERTAELAELNKKLRIASSAKSEFLANMSHELRTPLNGILGYAQILQRSPTLGENDNKSVEIIYQCGNYLLTLINDILDISKIEANKMELLPNDFHFPVFMQGIVEMFRIKAEQKGILLMYQYDAELPEGVHADEKRLRQVLINLLSNAIKFTNDGTVTFSVSRSQIGFRFEVRDTGIGMKPEQLETIFLPFEQVGEGKHQSQGTGLGLAISQKIVQMMNSQIYVESQVDLGSVFWFDLELESSQEWVHLSQSSRKGLIKGIQGKPPKILIVDDKWENRSVILDLLRPLGFELEEAENGQEGWKKAQVFLPDLIITDLVMPVVNGFEMMKWLRESNNLSEVAIIVSSASVFESDQYKSFEAGGDDFLAKPLQGSELYDKLQKHLHIEWVYEQETPPETEVVDEAEMIPPTLEHLKNFYELAMKGNFKGIIKQVKSLEKVDQKYGRFAREMEKLAQQFEDKEIIVLLDRFLH